MSKTLTFLVSALPLLFGCPLGGGDGDSGGGEGNTLKGGSIPPGGTGTVVESLLTNPLSAICVSGPGELYIASSGGKPLVSSDGISYTVLEGTALDLNGVACDQQSMITTNVWFVGAGGVILHYDGTTLNTIDSGITLELNAVSEFTIDNVVAVGEDGTILKVVTDQLVAQTNNDTASPQNDLRGVSVVNGILAYAVGSKRTVLQQSGTTWSPIDLAATGVASDIQLNAIWAHGNSGEVFVVGDAGTIIHRTNSGTWEAQASGVTRDLFAVHGFSTTHVWAVGEEGVILFYNGTVWTEQPSPVEDPVRLYGVVAPSIGSGFIVGAEGAASGSTGVILGLTADGFAQL